MNKKLGLFLALLFVGTTIVPAKKENAAPKKEKAPRIYTISVKNELNVVANLTIVDTENKTHSAILAAKETRKVVTTTDKKLKIKSITATIGNETVTKEFKVATRKAKIQDKNGKIQIKKVGHKGKKCPSCKDKKHGVCQLCKCKPCECKPAKGKASK